MWKNTVKPDRPQKEKWIMRFKCWILKATNPLRICNIYCLSNATMVTAKQLNFTFCLFFYFYLSLPFILSDIHEPFIEFQRHSKTCQFLKYLYYTRYKLTGFLELCNLEAWLQLRNNTPSLRVWRIGTCEFCAHIQKTYLCLKRKIVSNTLMSN
jgi:hypothetical protein